MNWLNEILDLFEDNRTHSLKIIIGDLHLKIYLINDEYDGEDSMVIPIVYECDEETCYIDDNEYRDKFHCSDYGIDNTEINYIYQIMNIILSNKEEIKNVIDMCSWTTRRK